MIKSSWTMLWILTKDPVTFTALSSISTQSPSTWCNSGMFWGNSEMILSKNLNLIYKMFFKQISFTSHLRSVAQDELNAADQEKMIGIAILSFISLVTLVFYFFVKNALSVIRVRLQNLWCRPFILATNNQVFAKEVMEKVRELDAEKMKTEKAFHDFLPTSIVRDMKRSKVIVKESKRHTDLWSETLRLTNSSCLL